ncbi:MAG: hypothetical protein NTY90_01570 [Candidatus Micrarchaeota archaeon]|nr:hypothetical protein [Candidatus Micrarchaeota archaeon]
MIWIVLALVIGFIIGVVAGFYLRYREKHKALWKRYSTIKESLKKRGIKYNDVWAELIASDPSNIPSDKTMKEINEVADGSGRALKQACRNEVFRDFPVIGIVVELIGMELLRKSTDRGFHEAETTESKMQIEKYLDKKSVQKIIAKIRKLSEETTDYCKKEFRIIYRLH